MSHAKRACLVAIALALGALLAGCVYIPIPYTPKAESHRDTTAVVHPERLDLSVGPHKLIASFENGVVEREARVQLVPGETLLDMASPDSELASRNSTAMTLGQLRDPPMLLTLGRLLDPATRARIAPLELDYIVLVGDPVDKRKREDEFFVESPVGFGWITESTSLWTAVIDAREMSLVRQSTSKATAATKGVYFFFVAVAVEADTPEGALRGAVTQVVETIAAARSSGPVRVAFLAVERIGDAPVPTDGKTGSGWSLQQDLPFRDAAPPPAGHGLVYVYRPEKDLGCSDSADVQTRSAVSAADVTRLGCGGYYPIYLPEGAAMLGVRLRSADAEPPVDLRVRSGETYYVRVSVDVKSGIGPIPRASLVEWREAYAELRPCRPMLSAYEHDLETMRRAEAGDSDAQLELARLYAEGIKYADGRSLPQDRAEAYKWYSIVESAGSNDALYFYVGEQRNKLYASEQRDKLTVGMDAAEIAEAKRRVQTWREAFVRRGPEPAKPQD